MGMPTTTHPTPREPPGVTEPKKFRASDNSARSNTQSRPKSSNRFGRKTSAGGLAVLGLVALYAFARPAITQRTGWDLPDLKVNSAGQVVSAKPDTVTKPAESQSSQPKPSADPSLRYGLLRDTGNERYVSPAGLMYTPGSAEGHRIEHVRRHVEDDPGRPGNHGVFDGGIEGALQTIDRAYGKAKTNQRTTKQEDDGRTIYTVDMGMRVGYVGGRDGGRKRNPVARRVMLVLEGNRVITAYPKE